RRLLAVLLTPIPYSLRRSVCSRLAAPLVPLTYIKATSPCVSFFAWLGATNLRRSPMLKTVVIGTTALFLAASSIANSQTSSPPATPERLNATDRNTLTDMRVDLVKAALQ